jgi:hypothetical protein
MSIYSARFGRLPLHLTQQLGFRCLRL